MKDFLIDERGGRRVVARLEGDDEVFVAIEGHEETELARRPFMYVPEDTDEAFDVAPSAAAFEGLVERRGYSDDEAADIIGVNARSIQKWKNGERPVSKYAWRLILLGRQIQEILANSRSHTV